MKAYTFLFFLLVTSLTCAAQKIKRSEIDEFTGAKVVESNWNTLVELMANQGRYAYRIRKVNGEYLFDFRILPRTFSANSVDKGAKFMFKLGNGDVVNLVCDEYTMTCMGCGAVGIAGTQSQGFYITYTATPKVIQAIYDHKVVKLRMYTNDGYMEAKISESNDYMLRKAIMLVASE